MICPACSFDNIEGMDACENCMESLRDLDVPRAEATAGLVRSVMEDELSLLEKPQFLTARPAEQAAEVVKRMKATGASCALVIDGQELAGIFTERDAVRLLDDSLSKDASVAISGVMTLRPETLQETDTVAAALNRMSTGKYLHIPIQHSVGHYSVISIEKMLDYIARREW